MLNIISFQDGRKGVLDEESKKLIIPADYKKISIQKYGIVAHDNDDVCVIYLLDGTPAVRALKNALLLDNNLLLTASNAGVCYIVDYIQRKYVCQLPVDAIRFFWGSNNDADIYEANKDFSYVYSNEDYLKFGAHIESLVGVRLQSTKMWGVYNIMSASLHSNCIYPVMAQFTNQRIVAFSETGELFKL